VDNERGKKIAVKLGDRTHALDESGANGHFRGMITLAAGDKPGKDRWVDFQAILPAGDPRTFRGRVQLLAPTGFTVISDIDDTIKVSQVRDKKALLVNTFLREYQPVFGMPALYQEWARAGAAFYYVSASPWQLYQPLAEFFEKAGYPAGSFEMKDFRWKDSTFFNLLSGPEKYKPLVIEPILKSYPKRKFILVGDSGEKDPEIYGALARRFPQLIIRILIRDVTGEKADAERYAKAFEGVPKERCLIFENPKDITGAFRELKY
jgi:phosphatidate phosphatase APP1